LFECLDKDRGENAKPRYERVDGFSRRTDSQPIVPDFLFFGPEREVDLSEEYCDDRYKHVRVRGLIHIFDRYKFTVTENTPIEEEIALDPELSGKVFENLLAAYNPETRVTARRQTGSFYTPREIVNYMVDETLIGCLQTKLEAAIPSAKDIEPRLRQLFAYNAEPHKFTAQEVDMLIVAIDSLKTIDPAVGSGAFPMGILHKLVFTLAKLDPDNAKWRERQRKRAIEQTGEAFSIGDKDERQRRLEDINEVFEQNASDYGRKLYLIENCIYGVDIQAIAVQIAKMRFFISLIVDQKIDPKAVNLGVRPLPNLETKFVAANTLVRVNRPGQQMLRDREIERKEAELRRVRERHFVARTLKQKAKCREEDARIRTEIADLLKTDGWDTATARRLAAWNPYDQNATADFFDAEWMFGIADGFEAALANPPYVDSETMTRTQPEMRRLYASLFATAKGNWDLFVVFIEKGYDLLKPKGMISFIVPNKLLGAPYSEAIRKFMAKNCLHEIRDYSRVRVFKDSDVYPIVFVAQKCEPCRDVRMSVMTDVETIDSASVILQAIFYKDISWSRYFTGDAAIQIDTKLLKFRPLEEFFSHISGAATVAEAYELKEVLRDQDGPVGKLAKRLINTGTIDRYCSLWDVYPTRYLKGKYQRPVVFEDDIRQISTSRLSQARSKKIIIGGMTMELECFYDEGEYLAGKSTVIILEDHKLPLKYILGILNSKLISYWYRNHFKAMTLAGGYLRIGQNQIRTIPIPESDEQSRKNLIALVDVVLAAKRKNARADTTQVEQQIDQQVYALYDLTEQEITLIERQQTASSEG
jgi:adenine-specific DNA-methyltransferase